MRQFLTRPPMNYAQSHRHNTEWRDHVLRTSLTASVIAWLGLDSVIDPACGDGSIVLAAHALRPFQRMALGDMSKPNMAELKHMAPDATLHVGDATEMLVEAERFDLVVLTEFLEHIADPSEMLILARKKADWLVASSPLWDASRGDDPNPEHQWQFDEAGYRELLTEAGWDVRLVVPVKFTGMIYDFQIVVARG